MLHPSSLVLDPSASSKPHTMPILPRDAEPIPTQDPTYSQLTVPQGDGFTSTTLPSLPLPLPTKDPVAPTSILSKLAPVVGILGALTVTGLGIYYREPLAQATKTFVQKFNPQKVSETLAETVPTTATKNEPTLPRTLSTPITIPDIPEPPKTPEPVTVTPPTNPTTKTSRPKQPALTGVLNLLLAPLVGVVALVAGLVYGLKVAVVDTPVNFFKSVREWFTDAGSKITKKLKNPHKAKPPAPVAPPPSSATAPPPNQFAELFSKIVGFIDGAFDGGWEGKSTAERATYWADKALSYLASPQKELKCWNKAIELNPNNDFYYNKRGNVYFGLNKDREAINDYTKAIQLNPKDFYYNNRGHVYMELSE
ncbi:MAG: tetratricopeptide repeat protein, partial [Vampirovibrionales bacterium]